MTGVELDGHCTGVVVTGMALVVVTGEELIGHCPGVVVQCVGHEAGCVWDVVEGEGGTFAVADFAGRSFDRRHLSA